MVGSIHGNEVEMLMLMPVLHIPPNTGGPALKVEMPLLGNTVWSQLQRACRGVRSLKIGISFCLSSVTPKRKLPLSKGCLEKQQLAPTRQETIASFTDFVTDTQNSVSLGRLRNKV